MLQTATAVAFNPDDPSQATQVRIVLDTGSQSSYITDAIQDQLSLKIGGERPISIATFGSSEAERRVCKHMTVGVKCKDNSTVNLNVFSIPTICQPIASHTMEDNMDCFPHLVGLDLADNVYTC